MKHTSTLMSLLALVLAASACGADGSGDGGGGGGGGGGLADAGGGGTGDGAPGATDATSTNDAAEDIPLDGVPGTFVGAYDGRDYIIHVPDGYSVDAAIPLLIGLHGACTPADEFWGKSGVENFVAAASPAEFILVIPESKGGCNSEDGFCNDFVYWPPSCDISDNTPIDGEADDLVQLVKEIRRHYLIDPKQIHLWGHSNGGIFVGIGGFARADYFATLSVFAMGWGAGTISTDAPSRDVPIQFVCGDDDAARCDAAQDSEDYFSSTGHPTRMVVVPGGGHGIGDVIPSEASAAAAFEWMLDHPLP